ncbi:outer membrane protein expression inhibitor [Clostridium cellulovorans 743B]|uniref:Outer membrane protein expression inhibitor n=1 Tax=Clostridium cellulovorans (strain ATCC 35296 / DSM 3052 / OCM 3 / 743B) TaxID=573061 RepID=D9SW78_CLOC7|nr:outer membrane protein expression inhibitor [Clostridium cellulovorans 743B]
MIIYLFSFLVIVSIGITAFLNFNPTFGGKATKEEKEYYKQLGNYENGKFVNDSLTDMKMNLADTLSMAKDFFVGGKDRNPKGQISVEPIDWDLINSKKDSLTWLGHSAFLVSINNKKLLLDPMLGPMASPVSFAGSKRYEYNKDILDLIDKMPAIDGVFISHDHYDHLDYQSILKLDSKVSYFYVPLGVGSHLVRWGVQKGKIIELNWWEEMNFQGLTVALTPSRHFSGRGLFNSNSTLWGGWVILGKDTRLYTSGDGGYGPHFKEIGEKYGAFDITLIEGAQYDKRWADIHMTPEQSVQANIDVNGKNMMLMHWGAFSLAFHGWKEPIERASIEAEKTGINLIAPKIGETIPLGSEVYKSRTSWWEKDLSKAEESKKST